MAYRRRSKTYGGLTVTKTDRTDGKQTRSSSYGTTKKGGVKTTTSYTTGGKTRVTRTFKDASGYIHKTQQTLNKTIKPAKAPKSRPPRVPKFPKIRKPRVKKAKSVNIFKVSRRGSSSGSLSGFGFWFTIFVIALLFIGLK